MDFTICNETSIYRLNAEIVLGLLKVNGAEGRVEEAFPVEVREQIRHLERLEKATRS